MRGAAWLESVRTEHVLEEFLPAVLCSLFALWSPDALSGISSSPAGEFF